MKKYVVSFIGIVFVLLSAQIFVRAQTYNAPCSTAMLTDVFTTAVTHNQDMFSYKGGSFDSRVIALNIRKNLEQQMKRYGQMDYKDMKEAYHEKQAELFKIVIDSALQNLDSQYDNQEIITTYAWSISPIDYPIIFAAIPKLQQAANNKNAEIAGIIPTKIVGIEALLNYSAFSCNYVERDNDIIEDNDSPLEIFSKRERNSTALAQDLLDARRIMEYALHAYDSLAIAYPQHKAYQELIKEISVLRDGFGVFEDISNSCVLRNHFNASCK